MAQRNEWINIDVETRRQYNFPNGSVVAIVGVTRLKVSSSGTHYLETVMGSKHIVAPGWLSIDIDATNWSV